MYKKTILWLSIAILSAILILWLLMHLTPMPNQEKNGFERIWLADVIQSENRVKSNLPFYEISGATERHIFLSIPNPQWVMMVDNDLKEQDTLSFPIDLNDKIMKAHSFKIDSPWVFFFANNAPGFIYGKIDNGIIDSINIKSTSSLFTRSAYLSNSSVVIRTFDSLQSSQVFQKIDCRTGKVINENQVVGDQNDMGFSTDGVLKYDSSTHFLIYLQNFQNRFFCLDTNLQIKYAAKTIDTTNSNEVRIKQMFLGGKDRIMPTNSRTIVNRDACVNNGLLYVMSGLRADNEDFLEFKQNTVVDIYQIGDGQYKGSFHIPHLTTDEKVLSIFVKNSKLVVLFTEHIATFKLKV